MVTTDTNASQQWPFSALAAFLAGIRIVMVNTTLPANIGSAAHTHHGINAAHGGGAQTTD